MIKKELHPEDLHFMPSGNRTTKPSVVAKIKRSISQYGILRGVVVLKTNLFGDGLNYYIADGQHLYLACQSLDVLSQLNIIVVNKKFDNVQEIVEFVSILNTTQSPWKLEDFVEAYASTHLYFNYNRLKAKKLQYDIPYNLLGIIYGGLNKGAAANAIKSGTFRILNEPKSDEVAQYIVDLINLFGRTNSTALGSLAYVFYGWYEKSVYNHAEFKEYITNNITEFNKSNEKDIKKLISLFKFKNK